MRNKSALDYVIRGLEYYRKRPRKMLLLNKKGEEKFKSPLFLHYSKRFDLILESIDKMDLYDYDYFNTLEKRKVDISSTVYHCAKNADMKLLKAMLTCFIFQERFCTHSIYSAVESGDLLIIFKRIKYLEKKKLINKRTHNKRAHNKRTQYKHTRNKRTHNKHTRNKR